MEKEQLEQEQTLDEMLDEYAKDRQKALYRHKLPAKLNLTGMLDAMTRQELDDIRYNLNVTGASSLKKAGLVEKLAAEIVAFAKKWFPSVLTEEYYVFKHIIDKGGKTLELRDDDVRLDYLRALGLVSCAKDGDKLAWYMPQEIIEEFNKINSGAYKSLAELNSETARLSAGILFYYGYMNYEELYNKVIGYLDEAQRAEMSFSDFVGVMLNTSCWKNTITALPTGAKYYTVIDENKLEDEQRARVNIPYKNFTYSEIYDAGSDNYIDATDGYKELAQFLMQAYGLEVLEAADIVGEIMIILQNGGTLQDAFEYLAELKLDGDNEKMEIAAKLLVGLNNGMHMWLLKGNTPDEIISVSEGRVVPFKDVTGKKVGRNEPCPCGSGKKYKNCCLNKDEH